MGVIYVLVKQNEEEADRATDGFARYLPEDAEEDALTDFGVWVLESRLPSMLQALPFPMSTHLAHRYVVEWAVHLATDAPTFEAKCADFEAMCYHRRRDSPRLYRALMEDRYGNDELMKRMSASAFLSHVVQHLLEHEDDFFQLSVPLARMYAFEWLAYSITLSVVPDHVAMHYRVEIMRDMCSSSNLASAFASASV
jgi:hypothetical protein